MRAKMGNIALINIKQETRKGKKRLHDREQRLRQTFQLMQGGKQREHEAKQPLHDINQRERQPIQRGHGAKKRAFLGVASPVLIDSDAFFCQNILFFLWQIAFFL